MTSEMDKFFGLDTPSGRAAIAVEQAKLDVEMGTPIKIGALVLGKIIEAAQGRRSLASDFLTSRMALQKQTAWKSGGFDGLRSYGKKHPANKPSKEPRE